MNNYISNENKVPRTKNDRLRNALPIKEEIYEKYNFFQDPEYTSLKLASGISDLRAELEPLATNEESYDKIDLFAKKLTQKQEAIEKESKKLFESKDRLSLGFKTSMDAEELKGFFMEHYAIKDEDMPSFNRIIEKNTTLFQNVERDIVDFGDELHSKRDR